MRSVEDEDGFFFKVMTRRGHCGMARWPLPQKAFPAPVLYFAFSSPEATSPPCPHDRTGVGAGSCRRLAMCPALGSEGDPSLLAT